MFDGDDEYCDWYADDELGDSSGFLGTPQTDAEKRRSEAYNAWYSAWAKQWNVDIDSETQLALANTWHLFDADGPKLWECHDCSKRYIRDRSQNCPYCESKQYHLVKWFRRSEMK